MRIRSGQILRGVLLFDAALMLLIGLPLWGSYPGPMLSLGIVLPDTYGDLVPWRAISMAGLFGGALMAFAATLVALALSRDHERLLQASPLVILGTCGLGFIAFAKVTAFGFPTPGYWMVLALIAPAGLLIIAFVLESSREQQPSPDVVRLRDAAGQVERSRLARDLHDSVKQQLYSVHAHLAAADARWDVDKVGVRSALAHARTGTRDALREMAALLDRLQTDPVEAVGLVEALRRQCDALGFQTGATVSTEFGRLPDADRVDPATINSLFRIGQEALANVARHARPTAVSVFAGLTRESDAREWLVVRVRDNGAGFDVDASDDTSTMGLRNMRERAREIGAPLTISSVADRGTSVEVRLPVPRARDVSIRASLRLFAGIAVPTLALLVLSALWPMWRSFLWPLIVFGAIAMAAVGTWAATLRWMKR